MLKNKSVFVLSIFILAISACNSVTPTVQPSTPTASIAPTQTQIQSPLPATQTQTPINLPQTADQVIRVSLSEAKRGFDTKSAIFVDARTQAEYETSHIKGALYFGDFLHKTADPNFDKSQWIITYCT